MPDERTRRKLEDIAHELDLLVFRLEQPPSSNDERSELRRALERALRQLRDVADGV